MSALFGSRNKTESVMLLAEFDAALKARPELLILNWAKEESLDWFGLVGALMDKWDRIEATKFHQAASNLLAGRMNVDRSIALITMEVKRARHSLMLESEQPLTISIEAGNVFDYYDEVRGKIDTATDDLLFVDPYLDGEFVSRYLKGLKQEVQVRLLTSDNKLSTLVPAVTMLKQQGKQPIEVRVKDFHDRFLFVDGRECYQSTSSFKDGPKKAPTAISQIVDAFDPLYKTYQEMWNTGQPIKTE